MSTFSLREGDLVFIDKPKSKVMGPLLPVPKGGFGIIVKIKPTKVQPANKKTLIYQVLVDGKITDIWGDDIKRMSSNTY